MNEFDLMGPQFLSMYAPLTVSTIFGAIILLYTLKNKGGEHKETELSAYDTAYLSGGDKRVVDAAVAKLLVSKVFTASIAPPSIKATGELPSDADPIERSVLQAVKNHSISNVSDIYRYLTSISSAIRPKLIDAGLILNDARTAAIRTCCTLMILSPVLFLGIPKLFLGLSRNKPVALLALLVLVGLGAAGWFFCQRCIRTARGDAALDFLRFENRTLEYSVRYGSGNSSHELAMATGLYGTAILLTSPLFAPMKNVFRTPVSSSSGCSSGSSCGSSCGGGGCGGGGCGGCGG
ncbi:MAG TPA: TIGR04222 domain-containing membrane protein [Drouetiella sp.]|jgi:uncharacterized protein (TIGR04222 family)